MALSEIDQRLHKVLKLYKYMHNGGQVEFQHQTLAMDDLDRIGCIAWNQDKPEEKFLLCCEFPTVKFLETIADSLTKEKWIEIVAANALNSD